MWRNLYKQLALESSAKISRIKSGEMRYQYFSKFKRKYTKPWTSHCVFVRMRQTQTQICSEASVLVQDFNGNRNFRTKLHLIHCVHWCILSLATVKFSTDSKHKALQCDWRIADEKSSLLILPYDSFDHFVQNFNGKILHLGNEMRLRLEKNWISSVIPFRFDQLESLDMSMDKQSNNNRGRGNNIYCWVIVKKATLVVHSNIRLTFNVTICRDTHHCNSVIENIE